MYATPFHTGNINDKKFLVTGGSGFIGSNIVEYLIKHGAAKVRVLDNLSTSSIENIKKFLPLSNFEFIESDIRNEKDCALACEGMDYVTHQAALGSVPRSVKNPQSTHAVNATGFLNVLVAARDAKVKRFIYASSSSVYGDHPALPKKEEETGNLLSPYAVSKKTNELYARVFASTYNMEIIGLRYFNIFGPNQSPEGAYAAVIPLFMQAVVNNESPYIDGDGEQTRDFTFVENAVQANIKAFFAEKKEALNQIYNIAVGERVSVNQLFEVIKKCNSSNLSEAKSASGGLKPTHRETRAGDIRNSLADISKARELIGYNPSVKMKEGLKITMDWFINNLSSKN
jgi:UDP-N-acetylglucosamine 4-epimerase